MAKPLSNLRLFVGLYPSAEAASELLKSLDRFELPKHRRSTPDQLHLTAQFIGDAPVAELDAVVESVERSASGLAAFTMKAIRVETLPERGPARLVAAVCDASPALLELHRRLAQRFAKEPRRNAVDRFLPHLTLCRFGSPTPHVRIQEDIPAIEFRIDRVCLMRSVLKPEGSEHRLLREFMLST